jgi:hypothetical protein
VLRHAARWSSIPANAEVVQGLYEIAVAIPTLQSEIREILLQCCQRDDYIRRPILDPATALRAALRAARGDGWDPFER